MDIALLNVGITFQKNAVVVDAVGNHKNKWTDHYSCYATVSGENGAENAVAATTVEAADCCFTVRYCKAVAAVTTTDYRIRFQDELYNILAIDHLSFRKNALKFKCRKVRR